MTPYISPSLVPEPSLALPHTLETWRGLVLNSILRMTVILGAPALFFGVIDALRGNQIYALSGYVAAYLVIIAIAFMREIPFALRAGIGVLLPYILGVVNFLQAGLSSDAASFLLLCIALTAILFGRRASIIALSASLLAYVITTWLFVTGVFVLAPPDSSTSAAAWLSAGTVHLMLGVIVIVMLSSVIATLERSLTDAQQERAFVSTVLDTVDALVMVLNPKGLIVRCNRACEQASGRSFAEMSGKHFRLLSDTPDDIQAFQAIVDQMRATGSVSAYERRVVQPDGTALLVSWSSTALLDSDGAIAYFVCTGIDITAQRAIEQERTQLQEAIIQAQAHTLQELTTPLIPLSETTIVMPLVGNIDRARSQQAMEVLLSGIETSQTRIAIIDITGVAIIDTEVANAIIQIAQATRLLGAQVVLTGIRPDVAQAIVGLGVDLSGIVTRSTLQRGIAYALRN